MPGAARTCPPTAAARPTNGSPRAPPRALRRPPAAAAAAAPVPARCRCPGLEGERHSPGRGRAAAAAPGAGSSRSSSGSARVPAALRRPPDPMDGAAAAAACCCCCRRAGGGVCGPASHRRRARGGRGWAGLPGPGRASPALPAAPLRPAGRPGPPAPQEAAADRSEAGSQPPTRGTGAPAPARPPNTGVPGKRRFPQVPQYLTRARRLPAASVFEPELASVRRPAKGCLSSQRQAPARSPCVCTLSRPTCTQLGGALLAFLQSRAVQFLECLQPTVAHPAPPPPAALLPQPGLSHSCVSCGRYRWPIHYSLQL